MSVSVYGESLLFIIWKDMKAPVGLTDSELLYQYNETSFERRITETKLCNKIYKHFICFQDSFPNYICVIEKVLHIHREGVLEKTPIHFRFHRHI